MHHPVREATMDEPAADAQDTGPIGPDLGRLADFAAVERDDRQDGEGTVTPLEVGRVADADDPIADDLTGSNGRDDTEGADLAAMLTGEAEPTGEVGTYLRTLEELTGLLLEDGSLTGLLEQVLELTASAISTCAAVSVTVIDETGGYTTAAASHPDADTIDNAQYELSEGPCIDSLHTGRAHHLRDLGTERRWPHFRERAQQLGYRSLLSMPLLAGGVAIGALNVFAEEPDGLTEDDVALAARIGAPAATTLANARAYGRATRLSSQLQEALSSRAVIEQAKGILMAHQRCGPDEAFVALRRVSQRDNRKLRDVAASLVERTSSRARSASG
jgi:GAF domain-containing protein